MSEATLTKEDVRDIVIGAIEALVLPRFDEHDKRFGSLEADMAEVKEDVRALKDDMRQVRIELRDLRGHVETLENDVRALYDMVADLQKESKRTKREQAALEKLVNHTHNDVLLLARTVGVEMA